MKFDKKFWIGGLFFVGIPSAFICWLAYDSYKNGTAIDYSKPYRKRGETVHDTIYVHDSVFKKSGFKIIGQSTNYKLSEKKCSKYIDRALECQRLNPSYSYCEICGFTWNVVEPKVVIWKEEHLIQGETHPMGEGTFATCITCWNKSTLSELKDAYIETFKYQKMTNRLANAKDEEGYTLDVLLKAVEKEYNETHKNENK